MGFFRVLVFGVEGFWALLSKGVKLRVEGCMRAFRGVESLDSFEGG